ncbi:hypothetical protein [uncultured Sphingomonas sp.]|uniref:hypothetical protein n=1 Tax=uncultured Sphingomonas sp. TaxID=158754 RepID=UPI0035C9EE6E
MTNAQTANAALIAEPDWFAHRFDPERDLFHLIPATRAELCAATFLTDENLPGAARAVPAARAATVAGAARRAPVHFLFHSAFCCSTLLARALDIDGVAAALKEPVILNDLIGWRGRGGAPALVARALDEVLLLLEQTARPGEAVLIKPSNLVNPLAPAALALRTDARAILLHAPLRTFIASVASKGLEGRLWVRDLWAKLLAGGADPFGFTPEELFRHSDLQVAALGWLAQHREFAALAARFGPRVATLSSVDLLTNPARALGAAALHYGLALDRTAAAAIAAGPIFTRHAKTGGAFDAAARDVLHRAASDAHREEIQLVERWAVTVAERAGIALRLARPLLA